MEMLSPNHGRNGKGHPKVALPFAEVGATYRVVSES